MKTTKWLLLFNNSWPLIYTGAYGYATRIAKEISGNLGLDYEVKPCKKLRGKWVCRADKLIVYIEGD